MSIQIVEVAGAHVTVKITGKITPAEQIEFQKRIVEAMPAGQKGTVLVLAEEFDGWAKGDWGNIGYQSEYDAHVRKMAIVGDAKWTDLATMFTGKGLRKLEIEMFGDAAKARAWLQA